MSLKYEPSSEPVKLFPLRSSADLPKEFEVGGVCRVGEEALHALGLAINL